jgi:hypothetical protein
VIEKGKRRGPRKDKKEREEKRKEKRIRRKRRKGRVGVLYWKRVRYFTQNLPNKFCGDILGKLSN